MKSLYIKIFVILTLLLGTFFVFNDFSFAESEITLQENEINTELIPNNPKPYQDITIKLTSYATDLNKAMIVWQQGNTIVSMGYGKTSYTFKTSGPNSSTIFDIKITPSESLNSITKRIAITPSEIVMMWEAVDGYTPPFYRGKSFVSQEGMIKVVAIPNTNTIKSGKGNIVYTWKLNDNTNLNSSGYGKDFFIFKNSYLNNEENVNVIASSIGNQYNATDSINIPIISPKIIFYKKNINDILYNNAISKDINIGDEETTLVAEPYFLPFKDKENLFNYQWKINGEKIDTPSKKTEITIRPTSKGGYADIELSIEGLVDFFKNVSGNIRLNL